VAKATWGAGTRADLFQNGSIEGGRFTSTGISFHCFVGTTLDILQKILDISFDDVQIGKGWTGINSFISIFSKILAMKVY
jgi:hypothetical protein